jgi:hypothetical protein
MRDKGQIVDLAGKYREEEVPELPPEDVLQSLPRQDLEHLAERYRCLAEALAQAEEAEAYAHTPETPAERARWARMLSRARERLSHVERVMEARGPRDH